MAAADLESIVADVLDGRRVEVGGLSIFTRAEPPASRSSLDEAESRLGVRLPSSYRWFVSRAGAGRWCDEEVPSPDALYAFDEDVGEEMQGMIAVVWNADGCGDYLAFKPEEASVHQDPPLYLCSHDPFGCNRATDSFGSWVVGILHARETGDYFYASAYRLMDAKLAHDRALRKATKQWWEFWK